uniref:Uncharacterized protein n=1 Tax=Anguilla anguilla TaxID=7936 RepID=A0A0E9TV66_ANGAN
MCTPRLRKQVCGLLQMKLWATSLLLRVAVQHWRGALWSTVVNPSTCISQICN